MVPTKFQVYGLTMTKRTCGCTEQKLQISPNTKPEKSLSHYSFSVPLVANRKVKDRTVMLED